jgi:endonuclease/exonuclease/phosphatase family metal-dependent hydrolase
VTANGLLENNKQNPLIVCGDMNDVAESATVELLHGPDGSAIGTSGFNHPDAGDDTRLFNLAPCIDPDRRYSRINNGVHELIDHILVSKELLPGTPPSLPTVDSYLEYAATLPSVTSNPTARVGAACSDHAPVIAEFNL